MYELAFRGVTMMDGTGQPGRVADVAVENGLIADIGDAGTLTARRVIEAGGRVLSPGFIDMHAHSDLALLAEPEHLAKISQGVTLEVLGQDGLSYAPVTDAVLPALREQIAGWNGHPDFDIDWRSVAGYLERLDRGIAVNACYLVPQGTVRLLTVGWDDRPPTDAELSAQQRLIATGLSEGAVGLSSGLTYVPGGYADDDELIALCRVVAEHDGFYAPHHRSYGAGALTAYADMIAVARRAGCALHLAHATMNFPPNAGRAGELLALLDGASDVDLSFDSYPYTAGSTTLAALLPSWVADGGPAATRQRLQDHQQYQRIRHELEVTGSDGCHGVPIDWATIRISGTGDPALGAAVGRTLADLAAERGQPAMAVFTQLLLDDSLATSITQHVGDEANVQQIMTHPRHTGGSDGLLVGARPHPRGWGTFPRYLGRYVRELGVLGLADCIAHLTSRPARRLRLIRRGQIRTGWHADLVLFDPARVADRATFDDPRAQSVGIEQVVVNGVLVLDDGRPTGNLPGHALRSGTEGTR